MICISYFSNTDMYANLVVEMKIYINRKKTKDKSKTRKNLIFFYDKMSNHEDYEEMIKENFHEIQKRILKSRKRKIKENDNVLKRFRFMNSVLKKIAFIFENDFMF